MSEKKVEGRNVTIWFPDTALADRVAVLAAKLKTSTSSLTVEVLTKVLPAIERNHSMREIPLDGVKVNV